MAGETVSLDYTPATVDEQGKVTESETPLYPGHQIAHLAQEDGKLAWVAQRVTQRITELDARRGLYQQLHTYPGTYATQAEALAAAAAHFVADGPGDMGGRNAAEIQTRADAAAAVHAAAVSQAEAAQSASDAAFAARMQALGFTRGNAAPSSITIGAGVPGF